MKIDSKKIHIGEVVNSEDPNALGRCKVHIKGLTDGIPVEKLPWATYGGSPIFSGNGGGGSISIPKAGTLVRIKFKKPDINSMEWYAVNSLDPELSKELASDYQDSHVLLYDSDHDLSIKFQPESGLILYYQGSNIQITPDNNITVRYGDDNSGTIIQLSDGQVTVQSSQHVNIAAQQNVTIDGESITINGKGGVKIKGDTPGECAINGKALIECLNTLANLIDAKVPQGGPIAAGMVASMKESILNQKISYI